jgi:type VI secretion system FHA domain protein
MEKLTNPMLTLRVAKYNDEPLADPIAVRFGPDGGTIGRATTCTLVLPDQQRAISRVHARVECRDGEYLLCDMGANPSVLNQRALGGTREARLAHGDQLMIGAYLLEVALVEGGAQDETRPFGRDPLLGAQVLRGAPEAEGAALPENPFAPRTVGGLDTLGQAHFGAGERVVARAGYAGSESDHVSPELQAFAPPVLTPAAPSATGGIPADYDPLADALAQWDSGGLAGHASAPVPGSFSPHVPLAPTLAQPAAAAPSPPIAAIPTIAGGADPLGLGPGGPTGLPASLLGDAPPPGATPFDELFAAASPVAPETPRRESAGPALPEAFDPLGLGAPASAPQPAGAREAPARELLPSVTQIFAPAAPAEPQRQPEPQVQPQPQPQPQTGTQAPPSPQAASASAPVQAPSPSASPEDKAVLAALLEGLGLDPTRAPNLPAADFARLVGAMLHESLRGTMAVLRARSMTKREARLDTTVIVERDNNPLKFFPDVDSALAQMLTGRTSGYLPPNVAVARAFVDIESHELAVLVGMRAALAQVLARFDPGALEAQLSEQGVLDRVLSNRKAKLWDRFVELREGIAREAQDDFQKLFGKAFNEAYEAQVDAMQRAREASAQGKPEKGSA